MSEKLLCASHLGRLFMARFIDLADREVLAVAISAEAEDNHIYLKERYPGPAEPHGQLLRISTIFQSRLVSKLMTAAMSGKRVA